MHYFTVCEIIIKCCLHESAEFIINNTGKVAWSETECPTTVNIVRAKKVIIQIYNELVC